MLKTLVLATRLPGVSVADFATFCTGARLEALSGHAEIAEYRQSLPLPIAYAKGEPYWDAMEEFWFADTEAMEAFRRSEAWGLGCDDVVVDRSKLITLVVEEHVVKDGTPQPNAVKSVIINRRRGSMTMDAFLDHWMNRHPLVAGNLPGLIRYEQNILVDQVSVPEGYEIDGMTMAWFPSVDALRHLVSTPEYGLALEDEKRFLAAGGNLPIVLTRESFAKGALQAAVIG